MLTQEKLKAIVLYDKNTGIFTSLVSSTRRKFGDILGTPTSNGYLACMVEGKIYKLHRLAWLYEYAEWPKGDIDHRDGNKTNNRIENLRICDKKQNAHNQKRAHFDNKSGYLGVTWHKQAKKWMAQININGKQKTLGLFNCKIEAHEAYLKAKEIYHDGYVKL